MANRDTNPAEVAAVLDGVEHHKPVSPAALRQHAKILSFFSGYLQVSEDLTQEAVKRKYLSAGCTHPLPPVHQLKAFVFALVETLSDQSSIVPATVDGEGEHAGKPLLSSVVLMLQCMAAACKRLRTGHDAPNGLTNLLRTVRLTDLPA